jgi:Protein of unknown function (DUF1552)
MTMRSTRRDFLGGMGVGVAAALGPFVPYLNRRAEAQTGVFPTRLLIMFSGNGSVPADYWPTGTETAFTMKPISEPLDPFKSKMIFMPNLSRVRNGPGGHESAMVCLWTASSRNPGSPFGGYSKGASIDQIIAKKLPQTTAFPSLEFGVQHDGPGANSRLLTIMCYTGSDAPLAPESSPYKMLDRLMLGSATAPTGIRPEDLLKIRMRQQSAMDLVKQELTALNTKIDRTDRAKLEQHLEGLTAIEKRLNRPIDAPMGPVSMGCGAPSNVKMGIDLKANASYPELLALQNSLAVSALACNRTRVASLQWSRSFSMVQHTWVGVNTGHHTLSHNTSAGAQAQKAAIEKWNMTRMAEFLKQMDSVPEGSGTLLDNTMIIYANELTAGAAHSVSPPICFVAGSGGKKLKTGRLLTGVTANFSQLLTTAAHVMGVMDVNQVGDLGRPGNIPEILA